MKIDFHTHTYYSYDCIMKPEKILRTAKKRGLDAIVICDHNTIEGGLEALRINKHKDLVVIVGSEIATDAGDITGIFLTKQIESRNVDDVIMEIKSQNGKVILNHPYKGHDLSKIDLSKVDFIEGYNSRLKDEDNQKAVALAKANNIPIVSGSDSHLYNEIGNCKTTIDNIDSLRALEHECKASRQLNITLSQYIKAFKKRKLKIFVSASLIQLKYSAKQFAKAIKR